MEEKQRAIYINSQGLIMGRLGTFVAMKLLDGYDVHVANAQEAVISGKRLSLIKQEKERRQIRNLATPIRGPFHYMRPDQFLKRSIRGMLPWKKPSGKEAYRRLKAYLGTPPFFEGKDLTLVPKASSTTLGRKFITVGELCKNIGWKGTVI
ncbi:MAG: 50S ribosomal protein L13 [Candidatus Ranarchaeia archaeon]|jgi:large subunit ribosomal protein L13